MTPVAFQRDRNGREYMRLRDQKTKFSKLAGLALSTGFLISAAPCFAQTQEATQNATPMTATPAEPEVDIDAILADSQQTVLSLEQQQELAVRNRCYSVIRPIRDGETARFNRRIHGAETDRYNANRELVALRSALGTAAHSLEATPPVRELPRVSRSFVSLTRLMGRLRAMTPNQIEQMGRERYQARLATAEATLREMSEDLNRQLGAFVGQRLQASAVSDSCSQTGVGRVFGGGLTYRLQDNRGTQQRADDGRQFTVVSIETVSNLAQAAQSMKSALFNGAVRCAAGTEWGGEALPIMADLERIVLDQSSQSLVLLRCHLDRRLPGLGEAVDYMIQCGTVDLTTLAISGVSSEQESLSMGGISQLQPPELDIASLTADRVRQNHAECLNHVNAVLAEAPIATPAPGTAQAGANR
jgi:hypothetical protein